MDSSMVTSLFLSRKLVSPLILVPFLLPRSMSTTFPGLATREACLCETDISLMTIEALAYIRPTMLVPQQKGTLAACSGGSRMIKKPATSFEFAIMDESIITVGQSQQLNSAQDQFQFIPLLPQLHPPEQHMWRVSHSSYNQMSQLDKQIEQLKKGEIISQQEVKHLCSKAREILVEEGNVQRVDAPVTICGDIHGQFYDLLELFKNGGDIPGVSYLFLGDFVDRGFNSVQTFLLLLAYKVRYPDLITLIRGNHECRQITQVYGFYDECLRKYGSLNVWRYCTDIFDYLSLAAIVDDSIFCVHGGLSPTINDSIDEIRSIDRKMEIPHDGSMCDLMWSDPDQISGWVLSPRGAGYLFGGNVVDTFNHNNNIAEIVRAHQLIMQGYKQMFNKKLVTVWSAPNYCYRCNNTASILVLDDKLNQKFIKFQAATHESRGIPAKKAIPEYFL